MAPKIAFIRKGRWPLANVRTAEALRAQFPENELREIDLIPIIRRKPALVALNGWWTLRQYASDLAMRRRGPKDAFLITSYIFRAVKHLVADLLRDDDYLFSFQMQSLFDASVPNIPHFVYTDHTLLANRQYPGFNPASLYHPEWMKLEPTIYQNANLVFTRSNHISRSLVEDYHCDPAKVRCVYAGSNAPVISETPDPARYASQNIVYVGIDWERKGGPELLQAFAQVRAVYPNATLTIIGANPQTNQPGVEVIGRIPVEQLPHYYQQAAVFCMPTKLEPFGIVTIEAMNYWLPVVSTNLGAMPDFIEHDRNGYLVEPGTVDQLATALIKLVGDPERCRRFGARSVEIAARYRWEAVGSAMREAIIQNIKHRT